MEAIERRALLVGLMVTLVLVLDNPGFVSQGRGWQVVVYIVGLIALATAGALLVAAIAPVSMRDVAMEQRERSVFYAFALVVTAMLLIALLRAYAIYHAYKHGGF